MSNEAPIDLSPDLELLEWDELAPGGEITATVLMASGFALREGQSVRERYHVESVLGEGGMGQVLAVSLADSTDDQIYALKVVARRIEGLDADDPMALAQAQWFADLLRQEAAKQDVVQRHGVGVARLFALVQLDDGAIGMRMELARGSSLEDRIEGEKTRRAAPPDLPWALQAVRKLLSQLRRLHELVDTTGVSGFIHSDIKPGNVFVDDSDTSDLRVTLLDFGVATAGQALLQDMAARGAGRKTFVLQQTGGTLGYAPPYHFTGKATQLSDVYAALVILYELITLDLPWDYGDLDQSGENILMLEAAMLAGPRPLRAVRPSVPADEAVAFDAFFKVEFEALHRLAESGSQAMCIPDEDVQRTMGARLTRLAREYQDKLEQLSRKVSRSRFPPPTGAAQRGPAVRVPRAAPVPRVADLGVPGLAVLSQRPPPPPPEARPAPRVEPSVPPRRGPGRASRAPWLVALLAVPATGAGVYFYLQSQRPRPAVTPAPVAAVPVPAADAATPAGDASVPAAAWSLAALSNAPVEPLRGRAAGAAMNAVTAVAAGAPAPPGGQRCSCLAPVRGAQVVARGGMLPHELVLCTASDSATAGQAEYYGSGVIAADVFRALPQLSCTAPGESLELTVRRFNSSGGMASLFLCSRRGGAAPTVAATVEHPSVGPDAAAPEPVAPPSVPDEAPGTTTPGEESPQPGWNPPARPVPVGRQIEQGGSVEEPATPDRTGEPAPTPPAPPTPPSGSGGHRRPASGAGTGEGAPSPEDPPPAS